MVLISELLDDQWDALNAKEGKVTDLHRGMEEFSAAEKAATEEISRLKIDLDHEVGVHLSREKELAQLRGKLEKIGSEMLKRDL